MKNILNKIESHIVEILYASAFIIFIARLLLGMASILDIPYHDTISLSWRSFIFVPAYIIGLIFEPVLLLGIAWIIKRLKND